MVFQVAMGSEADSEGCRRFLVSWQDDRGRVRGQAFYGQPGPLLASLREAGHRIVRRMRRQRGGK